MPGCGPRDRHRPHACGLRRRSAARPARPLSPCVPTLFTFWPYFLNSRVRPARKTRGVITSDRAGLAGRGGPGAPRARQSTGEYRRMGFLNMQRRRIQRATTVGFATVAIASFVAACGSSGGGGSSSGGSSSSSSAALSGTLNASGSTFQLTFQQAAIQAFKSVQSGMTVNYGGGGSGKGRTDLASGTVHFAGSDSPIPSDEVSNFKGKPPVLYFPVIIGPITVSYNLSGVTKPAADADGHREHLPGQDHEVERPGDHGAQPRGQPAQHRDHHRPPLGLLRHHGELLAVPEDRRRRGSSAAARPSTGRPAAGAATATAGWRRSSSPRPGPSGTWTTPTPRPPGCLRAVPEQGRQLRRALDFGGLRRRGRGHRRVRPDVRRGLGAAAPPPTRSPTSPGTWSTEAAEREHGEDAQGVHRLPARCRPEAAPHAELRAAARQHRLRRPRRSSARSPLDLSTWRTDQIGSPP